MKLHNHILHLELCNFKLYRLAKNGVFEFCMISHTDWSRIQGQTNLNSEEGQ